MFFSDLPFPYFSAPDIMRTKGQHPAGVATPHFIGNSFPHLL
jgi:hypothetical protein